MSKLREPLILAVETATRAGSVALARGPQLLSSASGDSSASHSTDLIEMVETVLHKASAQLSQVDLFAAAVGPGSFTGLRIGLATIKSFAACTEKSCAGISTLAAIAHAAGDSEATVALLPAGRGEMFTQMFSVAAEQVRELDQAAHLPPAEILEKYGSEKNLIWAGEGAQLQAEALRDRARAQNIAFNQSGAAQEGWNLFSVTDQLAVSIAALALNACHDDQIVNPNELSAVYVRASDAEINEKWQREN